MIDRHRRAWIIHFGFCWPSVLKKRGETCVFRIFVVYLHWKIYGLWKEEGLAKGQETPEDLRYRLCLMLESYKKNVRAWQVPNSHSFPSSRLLITCWTLRWNLSLLLFVVSRKKNSQLWWPKVSFDTDLRTIGEWLIEAWSYFTQPYNWQTSGIMLTGTKPWMLFPDFTRWRISVLDTGSKGTSIVPGYVSRG